MTTTSQIDTPPASAGKDNKANRENWLQATLASLPAGARILDAGAGTQQYRKFCSHLNYTSQDFGEYNGEGNSSGLQTGEFNYGKLDIVSDITSIPAADASFDAIMCIEVLEHVPNPVKAVEEFSRLLKPGGKLIITAPFCSLTHFAPYHFSSGLNKYWYETHLPAYQMDVISISANGDFFSFLAQEIGRVSRMSKTYIGKKPGLIDRLCLFLTRRLLMRLSKKDKNSSEVLCYGYHVIACKR